MRTTVLGRGVETEQQLARDDSLFGNRIIRLVEQCHLRPDPDDVAHHHPSRQSVTRVQKQKKNADAEGAQQSHSVSV